MGRPQTALLTLALALAGCTNDEPGRTAPSTTANNKATPLAKAKPLAGLHAAAITLGPGSTTPNLSTTPSGDVLLTWLAPGDGQTHTLYLARRTAEGWSVPQAVVTGPLLDNWADVATASALPDGTLVATWLQTFEGHDGYGIEWSRSLDDGATWSTPATLHEDTRGPEYGFVSTALMPDGQLGLYWLDGRRMADKGPMELRTAVIGREGPPHDRRLVDDRVCDCCQTSAAATARGPIVAYRNREVSELRDIHVAGPGMRLGEAVHDDGWTIEGCPVNGPSLGVHGERTTVAWYTEANETPQVSLAFGTVGGDFEPPITLSNARPLGRIDLLMVGDGDALVTWMERSDQGAARIVAQSVTARGTVRSAHTIAQTSAARGSGFPRAALGHDQLIWAHTVLDEHSTRVHVLEAPVASL